MSTTYGELTRRVMLKLQPRSDGVSYLSAQQAINDAQKVIADVQDFDELITLDETHAVTVANKSTYHLINDFLLIRPKDVYDIRLMDDADSRKLSWIPYRKLDEAVPYTLETGTDRSNYYLQRGMYIELYPIPDAVYTLYVQHSQWPLTLVADADQTSFLNIDHVIVQLSADMALSSLTPGAETVDWFKRAQALLGLAVKEEVHRPDQTYIAQPFSPTKGVGTGSYWLNPWQGRQPQTDGD